MRAPLERPASDRPRSGPSSSGTDNIEVRARSRQVAPTSIDSTRGSLRWFAGLNPMVRWPIGRDRAAFALRIVGRNAALALLIGSASVFWWLGREYTHRTGPYSPPARNIPKLSQDAVNYNRAAHLHLPVNLDGTAVVYPQAVA